MANQTSFKPGVSGFKPTAEMPKIPGRPKGTLNQAQSLEVLVKRHIRTLEQLFDEDGIQELIDGINSLPEREQIAAKLTLLEYVRPKLARLEVGVNNQIEVISIMGASLPAPVEDAEVIEPVEPDGEVG